MPALLAVALVLGLTLVGAHGQPLPGSALPPVSEPLPPVSQPQAVQLPVLGDLTSPPPAPGLRFTIDPKTPVKDLLPSRPKLATSAGPVLTDDLGQVPEVALEGPIPRDNDNAFRDLVVPAQHIAHTIAKIHHLNSKKTDGFIEALRADRPDLAALPMAMGDACRTKGERAIRFNTAANVIRGLNPSQPDVNFWEHYHTNRIQMERNEQPLGKATRESDTQARIAALTQVLAPTPAATRLGLAKHLATIPHVDATRALARLVIFSAENEVRDAAIAGLKVRREKDYTDILLAGLRYPWPAVAKRASDALVQLERTDVIPELLDALEEDDPRLPEAKEVEGKETTVVHELVRINHHRNCLLCHAPGNAAAMNAGVFTAGVPIPGQPLTPPEQGYGNSSPELLVRLDVTYLRQDFSVLLPVDGAGPWPAMQRFDFVVRTRPVTEEEAKVYREKLTPREPGEQTPYRRAVLTALRELTGKDAAPTPEAWRKLLGVGRGAPRG